MRQRYVQGLLRHFEALLAEFVWAEVSWAPQISATATQHVAQYNLDRQDAIHLADATETMERSATPVVQPESSRAIPNCSGGLEMNASASRIAAPILARLAVQPPTSSFNADASSPARRVI